ncbi:hypothetical protein SLS62_006335 [Diatrype stigma]|uniref:Transmembrane protein n=1 Tax=Diatrype stigma TaxID=117547 RepID=A0AAN9UMP3_9PEZI
MAAEAGSSHPTEYLHEGNWTPMFVFIALIPVIAVAVMLYSNWADRASERAGTDIEMAATYASVYQRIWFPWRDAVSASEGGRRAGPSTTATAGPSRPPVLPASFRAGVNSNSGGSAEQSSSANTKKHLAPNVSVTVTAPTPSPPPPAPAAAPRVPEPAARRPRSRPLQPYDHRNTTSRNERWGEGPHGYGSRRDTQRTRTPAKPEFQDVPF